MWSKRNSHKESEEGRRKQGRNCTSNPLIENRRFGLSLEYTLTKELSQSKVVRLLGRRFFMSQKTALPKFTSCFINLILASRGQHFLLLYPTIFSLLGSGCSVRYLCIKSLASSALNLNSMYTLLTFLVYNFIGCLTSLFVSLNVRNSLGICTKIFIQDQNRCFSFDSALIQAISRWCVILSCIWIMNFKTSKIENWQCKSRLKIIPQRKEIHNRLEPKNCSKSYGCSKTFAYQATSALNIPFQAVKRYFWLDINFTCCAKGSQDRILCKSDERLLNKNEIWQWVHFIC